MSYLSLKIWSKRLLQSVLLFSLFLFSAVLLAEDGNISLGTLSQNIYESFSDLAKLITAISYIAGLGFSIGAIMKFKQHKDNPTQIPIGTPIALIFIAAALLFLPAVLGVAGETIFGKAQQVAGPTGVVFGRTAAGT